MSDLTYYKLVAYRRLVEIENISAQNKIMREALALISIGRSWNIDFEMVARETLDKIDVKMENIDEKKEQ